jgi:hypothetical protein
MRIRVLRPAEGEVVRCGGPELSFEFVAEGLVYDAEYSWRFLVGEEQRAPLQTGLKIPSPLKEEECSDSPSVTLSVRFAEAVVPPGSYEVSLELLEEESDTSQVVCRGRVTFSVVDDCPVVQELAAQEETLGTHTHTSTHTHTHTHTDGHYEERLKALWSLAPSSLSPVEFNK